MAEKNIQSGTPAVADRPAGVDYSATGHPSFDQLMAEQGTGPITDVALLNGDFWPEEESIEEFLETLRGWRGHERIDPAASLRSLSVLT